MEVLSERGKKRRNENSGDDRSAGERSERAEYERCAADEPPAFAGWIEKNRWGGEMSAGHES